MTAWAELWPDFAIQRIPCAERASAHGLIARNNQERINFARCVYFLARLEPKEDGEKQEKYRRFSNCIYEWIQSEEDCRQLKTAICVYAYARRKTEGKNDAD